MRLLYEDAAFEVEDVTGLEELQLLVFSVTDVPAEDQLLLADGVGALRSDADVARCAAAGAIALMRLSERADYHSLRPAPRPRLAPGVDVVAVCSRVFFPFDAVSQPRFTHRVTGTAVCAACAHACAGGAAGCDQPAHGEGSPLVDAPFVCACAERGGGGECLFAGRVAERMDDGAADAAIAATYAEAALELPPHARLPLLSGGGGPGGGAGQQQQQQLAGRIEAAAQAVWRYGDPALQAQVFATVPVATLVERAAAAAAAAAATAGSASGDGGDSAPPPPPLPFRDRLLSALVSWFKADFFSWMGEFPPACAGCGRGDQLDHAGVSGPASPEEVAGEAGRVELYRCRACAAPTRVPRYNNPARLLTWRRGRCGEWANAFTAVAVALGFDARHVTDWSDHVWTEVWSPGRGRYVHVDPCEAAVDAPLLYERGWGKKGLSFMIAAGPDAVADVTRRYTRRYADDLLPRRAGVVDERWLAGAIAIIDGRQRLRRRGGAVGPGVVDDDDGGGSGGGPPYRISPSRLGVLNARLAAERAELDATLTEGQSGGGSGAEGGAAAAAAAALPGRITGSVEWRAARGELGNGAPAEAAAAAAAAAPPPVPQSGTVTVRPAPARTGPPPDEGGRYLRGSGPTAAQRAAAAAHDTRPTFPATRMGPAPAGTVGGGDTSAIMEATNASGGVIDGDSPAERAWPSLRRGPAPNGSSSSPSAGAVATVGGAGPAPVAAAASQPLPLQPPAASQQAAAAPAPAPAPSPADAEAARLASQAALRARVQRLFRQLTAVPPGAAAQPPCAHPHCAGNPAVGPQPPSAAAALALKVALAAGGSDGNCFCALHGAP